MPEFRFLTSSDEHLADQPPGFRKDDYRAAILEKLEWQGFQAREFGAHAVLRGGDFFHVKPANKTTMRTIAMASRIHRRYSCPTFEVPGNHDISNNNLESVPNQPLGVLFGAEVFRQLTEEIFETGSFRVRIVGVPYVTDLDVDGLHDIVRRKDENICIAVVHMLAAMAPSEKIQSFFNEKIFDYRDLIFNGCPDAYVFGHYHKDQGIVSHMGTQFVNLGAVSRGALTLENVERKPKVSLMRVTPNGVDVEEMIIPHRDANDVFDFELKKKKERWQMQIDDFVAKHRATAAMVTDDSMESRRKSLERFPDDLRGVCLDLLEEAKEMDAAE